jgi:hypothetical protein
MLFFLNFFLLTFNLNITTLENSSETSIINAFNKKPSEKEESFSVIHFKRLY